MKWDLERFLLAGLALLCAVALTGCKSVPTKSEKGARAQVENARASYRPRGNKPELLPLTARSGLSNYLAYAMLNRPEVEAAYYEWLASVERITTARSLPDPQITFQADIQNIVTSIMPGLMMSFPAPGKLRAGAEVAAGQSQAKYFAFQSSILQSAFEVKTAYYQLHFLDERIRINQETLHLVSGLQQLARVQIEVGKVTLQDVLRGQIEEDQVKKETANLEDSRAVLIAQFKAALGLRPQDPSPPLPQQFEATPLDANSEGLLQTALAQNARVKELAGEVQAAEAAIALAYKGRLPDTSLGLMADVKMNPVLYRPLATISLPIWRDKIAAQIAEAQAMKSAANARLSAAQINLAVAFAEKSFAFRQASRNLALLQQQLIPKQRQSLEVARAGYLAGQIDFFNLTDAEQTLLRFQMEEVEAGLQRELSLTELSLIIEGMPPSGTALALSGGGMDARNSSAGGKTAGSSASPMK